MNILFSLCLGLCLSKVLDSCQCDTSLLGNGKCDSECDTADCNWDGKDCENLHCFCEESMLGNGVCDWDCVNKACNWDGGDCCENWMLYNNFCDAPCFLEEFQYDMGACGDYLGACMCPDSEIGDHHCNFYCSDHPECLNERGDCCFKFEIGDGRCEEYCYSKKNKWDGGDCFVNPPVECECWKKGILGNGVCDPECDTEVCVHDFGDCCDKALLGNGVCDQSCNTSVLGFDGGDCISSQDN